MLAKYELDHDWWAGFLLFIVILTLAAAVVVCIAIGYRSGDVRAKVEGQTLRTQIKACADVDVRDRADCIERALKR